MVFVGLKLLSFMCVASDCQGCFTSFVFLLFSVASDAET